MITIPENTEGLIFDCDGTLVDSMPLHMTAWEYAFDHFGADFNFDFLFSKKGMEEKEIVSLFNEQFGTKLIPEITVSIKHNFFKKHIEKITPIYPVVDVVNKYYKILPMAVASGSSKDIVHAELKFIGIKKYFKKIITADDPVKPKPDPEIFLKAAGYLKVDPAYCVVFEDGDLGIEAGKKAGMFTIDVRDFI